MTQEQKRLGSWDSKNFYRCTICRIKVPRAESNGFCPECSERMRSIPHNPKHKRKLEAMGVIKRY